MNNLTPRGLTKLRIHSRRVASCDHATTHEMVVACPRREQAVDCAECMTCEEYEGLSLDRARGQSYVVCHVPGVDIPASTAARPLVADIMTPEVLCVRDDLSLPDTVALFLREGVHSAPVVDGTRFPIGMISRGDLLEPRPVGTVVAEVMTSPTFFVQARATVAEAAALMAFEGIHQVPVVSDDQKVLGLVSALDVLRHERPRAPTTQGDRDEP